MATSAITLARLKDHIETLSTYGRNADGHGITRSCWSPVHEQARAWLLSRMKAAGLQTRVDAAGNTFG
ncbi:MAG TPA: Zn-dependent hydrolase, partial [Candidatus Dormibacteraeota bacterium]|nr:Zn-dependent hydrolase [Candidatus Dormibacteraeota bacterium]